MAIPGTASARVGRRFDIRGTVQGVGFRPWIYRLACEAGLAGRVRNGLEHPETWRAYERSIERMERFLGLDIEVVAHDLHPDYVSTRYAELRPEPIRIGVQHHHAHVASAMAEHGLTDPVLGVAYDGTGSGTDRTAWGAELLLATYTGFDRLATFRALPLPGGDAAIREPWRIALALADEALDGEAPLDRLRLFDEGPAAQVAAVRRMIATGVATPYATGMGRYFDALGALGLGRGRASYEGQIALEWDLVADPALRESYPHAIDASTSPWTADLRPAIRAALDDLLSGRPASFVSARFHHTIVAATVDLVRLALDEQGELPIVLTGGCFQNARLTEGVIAALGPRARVFTHGRVPPGDGGLSLGQAVVAAAVAAKGR